MDEKQRYEAGMQVRRAVLGDAHVDRSLSNISEFNAEFQEMITRHAWGDIWTRPGLPRHTRSLITIAMLIGMNREGELKLHLRAARTTASPVRRSRKCCCRAPSTAASRRPTPAFTWPRKSTPSWASNRSASPEPTAPAVLAHPRPVPPYRWPGRFAWRPSAGCHIPRQRNAAMPVAAA